jgi:hypothetical protein
MKNILLIIIFSLNTLCVLSQDVINNYKSAADKEIFLSFDSSLGELIRCKEVSYAGKYDVETWSPNYNKVKLEKVKPQSISFTYSFFSKPINNTFSFVVSVTKKTNKQMVVSGLKSIPDCIKKNTGCNFITRESAIKIALEDSILYSDNLFATFQKRYNRNDYFWIIIGRPIEVSSRLHRRSATKFPTRSWKYINALTGQLISWQNYQKPN